MFQSIRVFVAWLLLIGLAGSAALAQPAPQPPKPQAGPGGDGAAATKPGKAELPAELREQSIYIPYGKLREIFEKEGRGVFLPYEKFQQLWKEARAARAPEVKQKPPVKAVITEVSNQATVGPDVVQVVANVGIEVLSEGWHEIALRLSGAAIQSATVDNRPARIVHRDGKGYFLLIKKDGEEPQQVQLKLTYAKAFTKAPGQNHVLFQAPQAPVNRWEFLIPEPGVKVNIQPLIAASEAGPPRPGEPGAPPMPPAPEEPAKETRVLAFVGAAPTVRFQWTPKSEGATGLEALANVQSLQQVTVDEGVVRTRTQLTYEISRAELSQLRVEVPADHKVAGVYDANVRQWEVKRVDDKQQIVVQLFEAARGSQGITVELEKFSGEKMQDEVVLPLVKALDVARQRGVLVVKLSAALRGEVKSHSGLLQLDASELPKVLAGAKWDFSYRYATLPFSLTLGLEKVEPRIRAEELVELYVAPQRVTLDLLAVYEIERAGVFQLFADIPAGYEVRQVRGQACSNGQPAIVDGHHLTGDDKTRLQVNLARKAFGRVGLFIELQKTLDDANLLTPTGESSKLPFPLPRVSRDGLEQVNGKVIVYAPESLQVSPSQETGLQTVSFQEVQQGLTSMRSGRFSDMRQTLAYTSSRQPATLELEVERRRPHITVRQLLRAQIDAGVVRYTATFFYNVRYSDVAAVRIDLPTAVADQARIDTDGVRKQVIDPAPDDLAEGYTAWRLTRDTELLGELSIRLTWEEKTEPLAVGANKTLALPVLRPQGADRAWGQIVLAKAENLDVGPEGQPKGLRPIDPQQDLMPGADATGAARAFEFHEDWTLTARVTRYNLQEVKRTSIERAVVRMVVTRKTQTSPQLTTVQALYQMRSARQRLEIVLPDKAEFDTEPLRINGKAVDLERGDQDEYYIPLVGQNPDTSFLLELRYTTQANESRMDLPAFPNEPAAQKVFVAAYLPRELALLGSRGPWTSELVLEFREMLSGIPATLNSEPQLLAWVSEGFGQGAIGSFPTDGNLYVFSTLRPPSFPDGSLRLATFNRTGLNFVIFAVICGFGLLLLARPLSERLGAAALLLAGLVACGVFLPTLSMQILNGVLLWSVISVLVLWLLVYIGRTVPQILASLSRPANPALAVAGAGAAATGGEAPIAAQVSAPSSSGGSGSSSSGSGSSGSDSSTDDLLNNPLPTDELPPETFVDDSDPLLPPPGDSDNNA